MTKKGKFLDPNQTTIDFDAPIEAYSRLRDELLKDEKPKPTEYGYEDGCIDIAVAIKKAIRQTNMSREEMVDAINAYFDWPPDDKRKCLTIHIFNHYLSKPAEYPIPAVYLTAIQHITDSLEPISALADPVGAKVISGDEVRKLALGKLDSAIEEMKQLKREFRKGRGK